MDLNENLSAIKIKRQRVRQPNWSEHEKEFFCALTKKHQAILEHKGSNSMILKCKSDAWMEIAAHMNDAGYYRPIDKLKQQLSRIRAANAKGLKETLEKSSPPVMELANAIVEPSAAEAHGENKENTPITASLNTVANDLDIKVEVMSLTGDESNNAESFCSSPTLTEDYCTGTESGSVQQSEKCSVTENLKPLDILNNSSENDKDGELLHFATAADLLSQIDITESNSAFNLKTGSTDNVGSNIQRQDKEDVNEMSPTPRCQLAKQRTLTIAEQRKIQIQNYRVAILRKRLYVLKMQEKRERILHRREVEIQNLKLEILRSTTNQI